MNICFDTFGCRLSRAEALEDEARCLAMGHNVVNTHAEADLVVVRGCSVTARAQGDCERLVRHIRRKYPAKRVFVTGCLPGAQRFDAGSLPAGKGAVDASDPVPMRTARAYLKVQDGCSCGCSFCIVPKFRGDPVSAPFGDVMDKARRFVDAGYREIVVTGCNLMLYSSGGRRLPDLVSALAEASPCCRVRLGSVEPGPAALELVHAMAERANVCRSLHISAQSGSDRILSAMRRPYAARDIDALADRAAELMPLVGLGCDLMAGFPDETENDFRLTKGLLARHLFSNVHAFPYSERPGTQAAAMVNDKVPEDVRRRRARELADIGAASRSRAAKRFLGRTVEIVVEKSLPISGWTGEYLWLEELRTAGGPKADVRRGSHRRKAMEFTVKDVRDGVLYGRPMRDGGRNG